MPKWCADSWAAALRYLLQAGLGLAGAMIPSGWRQSAAKGQRLPLPSAEPRCGASTTATMGKTPAWCAQVTLSPHSSSVSVERAVPPPSHRSLCSRGQGSDNSFDSNKNNANSGSNCSNDKGCEGDPNTAASSTIPSSFLDQVDNH